MPALGEGFASPATEVSLTMARIPKSNIARMALMLPSPEMFGVTAWALA